MGGVGRGRKRVRQPPRELTVADSRIFYVQVVLKVFDKRFTKPCLVVNEQRILRLIGSQGPRLTTQLLGSFHNSRHFFLVFVSRNAPVVLLPASDMFTKEYFSQGDLKDKIRRHGTFPLTLVRFYLAELVSLRVIFPLPLLIAVVELLGLADMSEISFAHLGAISRDRKGSEGKRS